MEIKKFLTVPALLILSHRLFLITSILGLILGSVNFGVGSNLDQKPEPTVNITQEDYEDRDFIYSKKFQNHQTYIWSTEHYASYTLDPKLYMIISCGVSTVFGTAFVLVHLFSKDLIQTTSGLFASFGMLVIVSAFTGAYNNVYVPSSYSHFYWSYKGVVAFHSLSLILLSCQVILSIWELCRQRVRWPTIHFSQFFTIGIVVRSGLFALSVVNLIAFLVATLNGSRFSYDDPVTRFPESYFMPCFVACLYGVLVLFEAIASQIFGHMHSKMMGVNALVSAVGYGVVTIISSPAVSDPHFPYYNKLEPALIFSSVLLCLSPIYGALCLKYPRLFNTPPAIIRYFAYEMSHMKCFEGSDGKKDNSCTCHCSNICQRICAFCGRLRTSDTLRTNLILVILSFVSIILMVVPWTYNDGCVIMLCIDVAILYRTLSALFTELSTGVPPDTQPFQMVFLFFLQSLPLLVGIILMYFSQRGMIYITVIIANVFNIIIIIFQFYKMQTNSDVKAKINEMLELKAAARTRERLPLDEEALNEEENDNATGSEGKDEVAMEAQ